MLNKDIKLTLDSHTSDGGTITFSFRGDEVIIKISSVDRAAQAPRTDVRVDLKELKEAISHL